MDPGHLEGLVVIEGREDRRKALGQQRLPGAGRPDHEQVMATGGGHLEGLTTAGQASYDGEVR